MNIEEYKESGRALYAELAHTVAGILNDAIVAAEQPYRYQHIERRAKSLESLRDKLQKLNRLDTSELPVVVKDLAGCRVVFYSNGDVERFLKSGILRENFEIDPRRTKPHYPVPGLSAPGNQFRSDNIVVRLKTPRIELPEYVKLAGLWCEVQVQTILNHSWSETAHNITYKRPQLNGVGKQLFVSIDSRLDDIMKKHLAPAGFAFQQVLDDYDRIMRAIGLSENGATEKLLVLDNNNDRKGLLDQIRDDLLPLIDDLSTIFPGLVRTLTTSVGIARKTAPQPILAGGATFPGTTFESYLESVAETFRDFMSVDVDCVTDALLELFLHAENESEQSVLFSLARPLAEQCLQSWRQSGQGEGFHLLSALKECSVEEGEHIIPIAAEIIDEVLPGGSIRYGDDVVTLRVDCVSFLKSLYPSATTHTQKLLLLNALFVATRGLRRSSWFIASLRDTLLLSADIVTFCASLAPVERLEIVRTLENKILWLHRNFSWVPTKTEDASVLAAHQELSVAILAFRDAAAGNERFVIFKTIVGYDSVFPPAWDDSAFEEERREPYRRAQLDSYVDQLAAEPERWFPILRICMGSVIEDGPTIGCLRYFLEQIGARHPLIAVALIDRGDDLVAHFYEPLLSGVARTRSDLVLERLKQWTTARSNLEAVAEYARAAGSSGLPLLPDVVSAAIGQRDKLAIYQCIAATIERSLEEVRGLEVTVLQPAIRFLTIHGDTAWLRRAYAHYSSAVLEGLSEESVDTLLENLILFRDIDHTTEQLLLRIARRSTRKIIDFFVRRIRLASDREDDRFTPVPYEFHLLAKPLAAEVEYVVEQARTLHDGGDYGLRDQSSKLVSNIFPTLQSELQVVFRKSILAGDRSHIHFILDVLGDYEGDVAVHPLCKDIVAVLPADDDLLRHLQIVLWNSGLLAGEFGHVMSLQEKRANMETWLSDDREKVREFAREVIQDYEKEMTSEQQRAETDLEMRKLRYDTSPAHVESAQVAEQC